eukprot:7201034-Prymnesium_polylepis.2
MKTQTRPTRRYHVLQYVRTTHATSPICALARAVTRTRIMTESKRCRWGCLGAVMSVRCTPDQGPSESDDNTRSQSPSSSRERRLRRHGGDAARCSLSRLRSSRSRSAANERTVKPNFLGVRGCHCVLNSSPSSGATLPAACVRAESLGGTRCMVAGGASRPSDASLRRGDASRNRWLWYARWCEGWPCCAFSPAASACLRGDAGCGGGGGSGLSSASWRKETCNCEESMPRWRSSSSANSMTT